MSKSEIKIAFPGGQRVDAQNGSRTIFTDQAPPRGDGSAPSPFDLFLASLGTCAGIYVLNFCQGRGIPTDGIHLTQTMDYDQAAHLVTKIELQIHVPDDFPEKYRQALVRSANQCAVKRHLENPPQLETSVVLG